MNVLVLGGGGREHALAWKLRQSPSVRGLFALPGNDGMAQIATLVPGNPAEADTVAAACRKHGIDLVVVGPEAPLAAGIVDALQLQKIPVFGPSRAAAQLEASKIFAKRFMERHGVPTAAFRVCDSAGEARQALSAFSYPVVLKADGLAAGKGVVLPNNREEALAAIEGFFSGALVGAAGRRIVIEEFLQGPEVSLLALCDGSRWFTLPPAQDHKRVFDNDQGPNTGGMGAYSVDALLTHEQLQAIESEVVQRTLRAMERDGTPFAGVLYCGLMMTTSGPKVLEYNVRFGDPETQAIMLRLEGDLAEMLASAAQGRINPGVLHISPEPSACVVLASEGYPGVFQSGIPIHGLSAVDGSNGAVVFHSGTTRLRPQGLAEAETAEWYTSGGRVLSVASRGVTLIDALQRCYAGAAKIQFKGAHYRRDIGARAARMNG